MEADTGAEVSVISEQTLKLLLPHLSLCKTRVVLKTHTDETMPVVCYGMQSARFSSPVLCRSALKTALELNWTVCLEKVSYSE